MPSHQECDMHIEASETILCHSAHDLVPMNCMHVVLQEKGHAETPADLRQVLRDEGLADGEVRAFSDSLLQDLLNKGLTTPEMLARADMAGLKEQPSIPHFLAQTNVENKN